MGFEIQGIDDLMKELSAMDVERVAPAMLENPYLSWKVL